MSAVQHLSVVVGVVNVLVSDHGAGIHDVAV